TCLVNTDALSGGETRIGTSVPNRAKAKAVIDAMVVAIKAGVEPGDIGIVVPYSGHKAQKEE
ncbi:hypothetical protein Pmar_PMAR001685, partial [Perkinsus marinus ATCC 50983]